MKAVEYLIEACENTVHIWFICQQTLYLTEPMVPYVETDKPNPQSYYAYTKYEAEKRIQESKLSQAILRTIIIYGVVDDNSRSNVVLWTINALKAGKTILMSLMISSVHRHSLKILQMPHSGRLQQETRYISR